MKGNEPVFNWLHRWQATIYLAFTNDVIRQNSSSSPWENEYGCVCCSWHTHMVVFLELKLEELTCWPLGIRKKKQQTSSIIHVGFLLPSWTTTTFFSLFVKDFYFKMRWLTCMMAYLSRNWGIEYPHIRFVLLLCLSVWHRCDCATIFSWKTSVLFFNFIPSGEHFPLYAYVISNKKSLVVSIFGKKIGWCGLNCGIGRLSYFFSSLSGVQLSKSLLIH